METLQSKDEKMKENLKEYKRIKLDYTFFPYIDQLANGELPEVLLNQMDQPQNTEERKESDDVQVQRPEKRGIMSWDFYLNYSEMGVFLSTSQCEYIAESRVEIAEALKI